ncbi:MAG: L,D-transpeptidase family protein [Cytophagaceae bacterium]|nr:L,D-transpeptidase family protein [Cytophagaceae bacterium]
MVARKPLFALILLFIGFSSGAQSGSSYIKNQINNLETYLKKYQSINQNEWYFLSCDSCLAPGEKSNLIPLLRSNLLLTGDLTPDHNLDTSFFDRELEEAVKKFQKRNGLLEDGIIGHKTIEALNVPVSSRIQEIKKNIVKWDSLSKAIHEPFILVNISGFYLIAVDSGKINIQLKTILGKTSTPTPLLNGYIESVALNPSWIVPYSISTKEILPMLQHDSTYLKRNNMDLFTYYEGKKVKVNPDSVNWQKISKDNFNYIIEQTAGKWNALGKIKFIMPNDFNIYLHDTPEKYLFNHRIRTYSHGCIRVENPMELVVWLLQNTPVWNRTKLKEYLDNSSETKIIPLKIPVPVSVSYFTAWVDEEGKLNFRENIYHLEESSLIIN